MKTTINEGVMRYAHVKWKFQVFIVLKYMYLPMTSGYIRRDHTVHKKLPYKKSARNRK